MEHALANLFQSVVCKIFWGPWTTINEDHRHPVEIDYGGARHVRVVLPRNVSTNLALLVCLWNLHSYDFPLSVPHRKAQIRTF